MELSIVRRGKASVSMRVRLAIAVSLIWGSVVLGADRALDPTFESDGNLSPRSKIDRAVFAKLRQEKH